MIGDRGRSAGGQAASGGAGRVTATGRGRSGATRWLAGLVMTGALLVGWGVPGAVVSARAEAVRVPTVTIAPAATPVTGPIGNRRIHFVVTRNEASDNDLDVRVRISGLYNILDDRGLPSALDVRDSVVTVRIPAGAGREEVTQVVGVIEPGNPNGREFRATVLDSPGSQYRPGSPRDAVVALPGLPPAEFAIDRLQTFTSHIREGARTSIIAHVRSQYSASQLGDNPTRRAKVEKQINNAIKFSGTATAGEDTNKIEFRLSGANPVHLQFTAFVNALKDGESEPNGETLIASVGPANSAVVKSALTIVDAGRALGPTFTIIAADPPIETRADGRRFVRAIVRRNENIGDSTLLMVTATGPIFHPTIGGPIGELARINLQVPKGTNGRQTTLSFLVDEAALHENSRPVTLALSDAGGSQVVIGNPGTVSIPIPTKAVLAIATAEPAIVGPVGQRKARFVLTSNEFLDGPTTVSLYASGPIPARSAGKFNQVIPAGPEGRTHTFEIPIDEKAASPANRSITATILRSGTDEDYVVDTRGTATATIRDHLDVAGHTRRVIARHMNRVAELITSDTGRARLRQRQQRGASSGTTAGGAQPYRLGGDIQDGAGRFAANITGETSLSRLRGAQRAAVDGRMAKLGVDPARYGLGRTNPASAAPHEGAAKWDVWVSGKFGYQRTGSGETRSTSLAGLLRAGADYLVSSRLLIGVMAQVDRLEERSTRQSFSVKGLGWMVGPYVERQLSEHIYFDAKLLGGNSSNEVAPYATYSDTFETTRLLASARLAGHWEVDGWSLSPSVEVVSYRDRQLAYTDSNGIEIGGQTVRVNRLNFGPEVSRQFTTRDGTSIRPRLAVRGLWSWGGSAGEPEGQDGDGIVVDPVGIARLQGRIEAGVQVRTPDGLRLDLDGSYDGIGQSDRAAASVSGRVSIPLQ